MINVEELKTILGEKVKLNNGKRDIDINIREMPEKWDAPPSMSCLV